MEKSCDTCQKRDTCKKSIGFLFGFCESEYKPKTPEPAPLRVCPRCLSAIESHEGRQVTRIIDIDLDLDDDEKPVVCDWCDESDSDILYEIL